MVATSFGLRDFCTICLSSHRCPGFSRDAPCRIVPGSIAPDGPPTVAKRHTFFRSPRRANGGARSRSKDGCAVLRVQAVAFPSPLGRRCPAGRMRVRACRKFRSVPSPQPSPDGVWTGHMVDGRGGKSRAKKTKSWPFRSTSYFMFDERGVSRDALCATSQKTSQLKLAPAKSALTAHGNPPLHPRAMKKTVNPQVSVPICYPSRPNSWRNTSVIETNPIRFNIEDLTARLDSLRGYL